MLLYVCVLSMSIGVVTAIMLALRPYCVAGLLAEKDRTGSAGTLQSSNKNIISNSVMAYPCTS